MNHTEPDWVAMRLAREAKERERIHALEEKWRAYLRSRDSNAAHKS